MTDPAKKAELLAAEARAASRAIAKATTAAKNGALLDLARRLRAQRDHIAAENAKDIAAAEQAGMTKALLDRLRLGPDRIDALAVTVEDVAALPDPVGERVDRGTRPDGLRLTQMRIPLGVVLMIHEARPGVVIDASALCIKSGNAVILKPGRECIHTVTALMAEVTAALDSAWLPRNVAQLVPGLDREITYALLEREGSVDVAIPRGGESLVRAVTERARVPVMKHYKGVCHLYLDETADPAMAVAVALDGKVSRPSVCNALECILVDQRASRKLLPLVGKALVDEGVELRCDEASLAILRAAGIEARAATHEDFGREFLDLVVAVAVVIGIDDAIAHVEQYGTEHTEVIITQNQENAQRWVHDVTASAVVVNSSSRFNDGGQLGLGTEIGTSTSRLHAYGPMGLRELTALKWVVEGAGQVRHPRPKA